MVIAADSFVVRQGPVALLGTEPDIEVVATAETFDDALHAAMQHRPDVVLTDIRMPPTGTDEGIRLAETLRFRAPEIGVVVLSQHADSAYALELLGAVSERRSYLQKERIDDADQLIGALRTVAAGGSSVDPSIVDALISARSAKINSPIDGLTPRESDILAELATGRSNAAIAEWLSLFRTLGREVHQHAVRQARTGRRQLAESTGESGVALPVRWSMIDVAGTGIRDGMIGSSVVARCSRAMGSAQAGAMTGPVRVMVVDDQPSFLRAAARSLAADPALDVVRAVGSASAAFTALKEGLEADIALIDLSMPEVSGVEAIA